MEGLMTEKTIRLFVPAFFAIYFVIGFGRWIGGAHEIYPIGAWGMYHYLPRYYDQFDLRVYRLAGRDFDPPIYSSTADPQLGIGLDGHRNLVINGYVRNSKLHREERALPYLDFTSIAILGPDSKYEILRMRARSRRNERKRQKTTVYGPFVTADDQSARLEGARFEFPAGGKFKKRPHTGHQLLKRKKTGG